MNIFIFWGAYIGGIISGLLVSILVVLVVKKNPFIVEKIKSKLFSKEASIVDVINPLDKVEI